MTEFSSPKIVFGRGSLDQIGDLIDGGAEKAMIVTDAGVVDLGYADLVREKLEEAGLEVKIFDEVEPDPSISTAEKGGKMMSEFGPDWIVGLGGGSCMDAAKAMWVRYENPEIPLGGINPFTELGLREKAKYMTIPTTSGTGADSTWAVILTDKEEGVKLGLASREVIADVAIIDPKFPKNMPKKLTAGSGLDVLGHAFSGYVSAWKNDFADGMCLQASKMAWEYLPKACEDPDDMEAREKMHNAATIAGLGFGNSQATIEHSIAHAVGAVHHLHHGLLVGIALPYTIQFQSKEGKVKELYADLAAFLGIDFDSREDAPDKLAEGVLNILDATGSPKSYGETEITDEEWSDGKEKVIKNALGDPCTMTTRRTPSKEEMEKLVDCCWEGKKVDF